MAGLPKQARLLNKKDYNSVFSKSVKVSNSLFLILIHKTTNPYSRLGLVISKKVDKRAVQRNRIKRIVRESFRESIKNKIFVQNCDYVILARSKAVSCFNKDLFLSLDVLWKQSQSKIKSSRKKK